VPSDVELRLPMASMAMMLRFAPKQNGYLGPFSDDSRLGVPSYAQLVTNVSKRFNPDTRSVDDLVRPDLGPAFAERRERPTCSFHVAGRQGLDAHGHFGRRVILE
jgi:hypothetical protein